VECGGCPCFSEFLGCPPESITVVENKRIIHIVFEPIFIYITFFSAYVLTCIYCTNRNALAMLVWLCFNTTHLLIVMRYWYYLAICFIFAEWRWSTIACTLDTKPKVLLWRIRRIQCRALFELTCEINLLKLPSLESSQWISSHCCARLLSVVVLCSSLRVMWICH